MFFFVNYVRAVVIDSSIQLFCSASNILLFTFVAGDKVYNIRRGT